MRKDKEKFTGRLQDFGHEVSTARGRLEGALQILIEKTESEGSDESDVDVTDLLNEGRSMSASPRKMSAMKAPLRKRRRINVEKGHKNDSNSYVLKLYDRSVNLAKFSPNTALYPVCRAWIKNQPNSTPTSTSIKLSQSPTKTEDKAKTNESTDDEPKAPVEVTSLPLPEPMPVDDDGENIDTRIPIIINPLKKSSTLDFLFPNIPEDEVAGPSAQSLLQENLTRWWKVKGSWKKAAFENEIRYAESTKILKSILVRP